MKKIVFIIFLAISLNAKAQIVRPYIGAAGYLYSGFEKSLFVGVDGGTEFKINRFIKPEIDISYFYGTNQNKTNYGSQGQLISVFSSTASALNFNFCPKICIGNDGQRNSFLVILPKYTFSKVTAVGEFTTINSKDVKTTTKETITDWQHSLGIGIGVDFSISSNNTDSFCVNIYYQNVDMGKALNQLSHNGEIVNTNNVLGLGFNYYFGIKTNPEPVKITKPDPLK
ncbi:hypothetical protein [Flavobacterium sp. 5]|uniref:hypothetical protein n=1 Tax=Flavobacterium sp. 5 TaxID=2035199 RepID=UPI000C2C8E2C|nr:hypothetical protein [Flavobacterium sp. 5]PKB18869.1 hypothetical protein CLU82_4164 [Flavobacterium sp. 5]